MELIVETESTRIGILSLSLLVAIFLLSDDSLCKQFGPRLGLTDRMLPGPDLHLNCLTQHANLEILVFIEQSSPILIEDRDIVVVIFHTYGSKA